MLDMERLFCHLRYIHENPPAGTLIKAYFEARANASGHGGGNNIPSPKPMSKERQKEVEERQAASLLHQFGGGRSIENLPHLPKRRIRRM